MSRPAVRGRRWSRAAAVAVLAAALGAGCGSESNPVGPGNSGAPLLIAFSSNRPPSTPSSTDVYFYNGATGGQAFRPPNLDSPFQEAAPGLSGDGRWLAYNSLNPYLGAFSQLALYSIPTGTVHLPSSPGRFDGAFNPSLSYDGHYLAFHTSIGTFVEYDVVLMDAFADTVIATPRLHTLGAIDFDPSLSGDGRLIAFSSNRSGTFDVLLYDVAGDSLIPLPGCNSGYTDLAVSISRDGRYLAFESDRAGGQGGVDVYVYDRVTASLLALPGANTTLDEANPALSPDGRWLVFNSSAEGAMNLRLYDLATRRLVPVPGANDPYFVDDQPSVADLR